MGFIWVVVGSMVEDKDILGEFLVVWAAMVFENVVVAERMDEVVIVMNVVPVDGIDGTILEVTIGVLIVEESVLRDVDAYKVVVDVKVVSVVVIDNNVVVDCGWCKVVLPVDTVNEDSKVESVVIWLIMVVFKSLLDVKAIVDRVWFKKSFLVVCKVVVSCDLPVW